MSITLTPTARRRVQHYLEKEGGEALRLGVRRTGCSGWAYTVDIARAAEADDTVFEDEGIRIVVDRDSLPLLDGMEVDYVTEGLNHTFRFENPNATDACGCGESFTVG